MTNRTVTADADARALHAMQRGPAAHHCPIGHGVLRVWPDVDAPSGLSLVCTVCGRRVAATAGRSMATGVEPEAAPAVRLTDGTPPRGLRQDGSVRTSGCVRVGGIPVSSGFWAALAPFLATAPLAPWLPVIATPLGYLTWKLCTTKWLPASQAVNIRHIPAAELAAGQRIRLYGTAGPAGEVSSVSADGVGQIRVRMAGGLEFRCHPGRRVWQVELRN